MHQLDLLKENFIGTDWFYDTGLDNFNRPVVYVHYMNSDIFAQIRAKTQEAIIHYSSYSKCKKENYIEHLNPELELDHLNDQIRYLTSICKKSLLQDIFYEVHDGSDAVTNFSSALSDVRQILEDLYNTYGYDLLYERLEA